MTAISGTPGVARVPLVFPQLAGCSSRRRSGCCSSASCWYMPAATPLRAQSALTRLPRPQICAPGQCPWIDRHAGRSAAVKLMTNPQRPDSHRSAATAADEATPANCVASDPNFLDGGKIWEYQYILMLSVLFCVFWYFYRRSEWYWWSVVGTTVLITMSPPRCRSAHGSTIGRAASSTCCSRQPRSARLRYHPSSTGPTSLRCSRC